MPKQVEMSAVEFQQKYGGNKAKQKYGNRRVVIDGIRFQSKREADRFGQLKIGERCGLIRNLRLQVPFKVHVNGRHVFSYVADFVFERAIKVPGFRTEWLLTVEDVKGIRTHAYRMKKKSVEAEYGFVISEV